MTIGSHQRCVGKSQTHLTPPELIRVLGEFDLDPCAAPLPRPWPSARWHITLPDDGLAAPWRGRVWLNPPFDRYQVGAWVDRLAQHGDGILLVHARTETDWFNRVWRSADALLFKHGRVTFHKPSGEPHSANSGAPVVLAAYGASNVAALERSGIPGRLVTSWAQAEAAE